MIDYRSDNTGRAAPQILEALVRANHDTALGYGGDEWTAVLQQRFSELFEASVRVFPVATGTAANALALATLGPSWGIVYCSEMAHINTSEANATGFFGCGTKLAAIGGAHGKIDADRLGEALAGISPGQLHRGQPAAVSGDRSRRGLQLGRDPSGRRGGKAARPQAPHGRGTFRQRRSPARLSSGRPDLAVGRRHHELRRD
jgi:threonine aldolase